MYHYIFFQLIIFYLFYLYLLLQFFLNKLFIFTRYFSFTFFSFSRFLSFPLSDTHSSGTVASSCRPVPTTFLACEQPTTKLEFWRPSPATGSATNAVSLFQRTARRNIVFSCLVVAPITSPPPLTSSNSRPARGAARRVDLRRKVFKKRGKKTTTSTLLLCLRELPPHHGQATNHLGGLHDLGMS